MAFLVLCFAAIFFGARGCIATQESAQVRKYVTGADSTLSDSANVGNEQLEAELSSALEGSGAPDPGTMDRAADATQKNYLDALRNEEVPPEFEDAHHYMVSALGVRAAATGELAEAAGGEGAEEEFGEALSSAIEDYKLSDAVVQDHYVPASEEALRGAARQGDQNYLYEPEPFMDYDALGLSAGGEARETSPTEEANASRDVRVSEVRVAGRPLSAGGDVTLTGSDEVVFSVTVGNGGEVTETGVPVEVVLNTRAERQSVPATVERVEPGGTAVVDVWGFRPGAFEETAEVEVEAGSAGDEKEKGEDNSLTGTVTFGV